MLPTVFRDARAASQWFNAVFLNRLTKWKRRPANRRAGAAGRGHRQSQARLQGQPPSGMKPVTVHGGVRALCLPHGRPRPHDKRPSRQPSRRSPRLELDAFNVTPYQKWTFADRPDPPLAAACSCHNNSLFIGQKFPDLLQLELANGGTGQRICVPSLR
jgi:hypothetical protein